MKKTIHSLAPLSLLALSLTAGGSVSAQQQDGGRVEAFCWGAPCTANIVAFASGGFTQQIMSQRSGKSFYENDCSECKDCTGRVLWGYTGDEDWTSTIDVDGQPPTSQIGNGGTAGVWSMRTPCDGIPIVYSFETTSGDGGSAELYCPCNS